MAVLSIQTLRALSVKISRTNYLRDGRAPLTDAIATKSYTALLLFDLLVLCPASLSNSIQRATMVSRHLPVSAGARYIQSPDIAKVACVQLKKSFDGDRHPRRKNA